jgi:hypothetical protein
MAENLLGYRQDRPGQPSAGKLAEEPGRRCAELMPQPLKFASVIHDAAGVFWPIEIITDFLVVRMAVASPMVGEHSAGALGT